MSQRDITARAPVRIDFAGSWTDVPRFAEKIPGAVVNAAITLYTYVTVRLLPDKIQIVNRFGYPVRERMYNESIHMYSADFDTYEHAASVADIEYNGTMDLAKAACKRLFTDFGGIQIVTSSDVPPGSGLGTSASLGVALIGALNRYRNLFPTRRDIANDAFKLETEELGLLSGTQDQYAAAYGGITYWECYGDKVFRNSLFPLDWSMRFELEKRLVLCYTGKSRLSSDIHVHVNEAFDLGKVDRPLAELVASAGLARDAFHAGDIRKLGEAMNASWVWQKEMHSSVTNADLEKFFAVASENGMQAGKACGAGGGGCLLFLAEKGQEYVLRQALQANGGQLLRFCIDDYGLGVWE